MRRGIGLRGYAQQDPLNEFKKEAFGLYEELRALIRHQVATTIFRVTVTRGPAPGSAEEQLASDLAAGADAVRSGGAAGAQKGGRNAGNAALGSGAPIRALPKGPDMRGTESLGDRAVADGSGGGSGSSGAAGGGGGGGAAVNDALRPGFTPAGARIGRNDPCFCGSGLKYKKCHGR
jgi:preprotein translocase subunit SecA